MPIVAEPTLPGSTGVMVRNGTSGWKFTRYAATVKRGTFRWCVRAPPCQLRGTGRIGYRPTTIGERGSSDSS
jgi:hypothetical protein